MKKKCRQSLPKSLLFANSIWGNCTTLKVNLSTNTMYIETITLVANRGVCKYTVWIIDINLCNKTNKTYLKVWLMQK